MKKTTKIYLFGLTGLCLTGAILGTTLPLCLTTQNSRTLNNSNSANSINNLTPTNSTNSIYKTSGNMLMYVKASYSAASTNNSDSSIPTSNNPLIYSDELNNPNMTITIHSNITSSSNNPITYTYYASDTAFSNSTHPVGGVVIVSNSNSSSLVLNQSEIQKYKYWYVVGTQVVNNTTYTITTNVITLNYENGPITASLVWMNTNSVVSNELVNGFPTLKASFQNLLAAGGNYQFRFYGTYQNNLYVTSNLLSTQNNTQSTWTLNKNQLRCNYKYFFVQVQYTLNNQIYIANSSFLVNKTITNAPISNVTLTISNSTIANNQISNFPSLTVNVKSSSSITSSQLNYVWYGANNHAQDQFMKTTTNTFTLQNYQVQWLKQNGYNTIFCQVYETSNNQEFEYTSNDVVITFSNVASPLSTKGCISSSSTNIHVTNSASSTQPINSQPKSTIIPSAKENNTKNENTPVDNLKTTLFLKSNLNLADLNYTKNALIAGLINEINALYSPILINNLFTTSYSSDIISITNLIYSENFSTLIGFNLTNNSDLTLAINNITNTKQLVVIPAHQNRIINLTTLNAVIHISNNLNSLQSQSFTYNLTQMLNTKKFPEVETYFHATEYLADGYAYLYPILWTQDNDNCLSYQWSSATYQWNQGFGPQHPINVNPKNEQWTTYISSGDNPVIYMTNIAGMLGLSNNLLNQLQAYEGYVPQNNQNKSIIINRIEINNCWFSVYFQIYGGTMFSLA